MSLPTAYYQSQMCNELSKYGNISGYNVVVFCNFGAYDDTNPEYAVGECSIVDLPDLDMYDGVILLEDTFDVPGMFEHLEKNLNEHPDIPIVSVRKYLPQYYNVLFDESTALDGILDHILGFHKFRKVYYVSGTPGRRDAEERLGNYKRKMEQYGCPYEEDWIFHGNFWTDRGVQTADWIEEQGMPEAVVCANDYMAIALMEELENRGYTIPRDVVITGFDDIDKASLNSVSLSTVNVSPRLFAKRTIEVMDRLLHRKKTNNISYITTELVVRDSCGCKKRDNDELLDMSKNMYFQYENSMIYNERNSYFSRAAQNKKDLDSVMSTGAYYSNMIEAFEDIYFVFNENGESAGYSDQVIYKYHIDKNQVLSITDEKFDTKELFPFEKNNTPQRLYVVPLHHEEKIFGYVGLDTGDDKPVGLFFSNFLATITNSIERMYQEQKVYESMLRVQEARDIAEKANRVKDDFLINLSHEVRTPLNTIIGLANMLHDEELSEEGMEYLESIRYAGDNLLRMLGDILDYCELTAGTFKIKTDRYSTEKLENDVDKMLEMFCRNKENVKYSVNRSDNVPSRLIGDKDRIEQIMVNLCSNAAKFTQKGRVKVLIRWKEESKTEGRLVLAVMDTGMGIDKKDIDKIFDAFSQIDATRKRSNEGSGIGLAVCQMLIKAMNGTISVDSIPNKGSCFTVELPQTVGEASTKKRRRPVSKNKVLEGVSGSKVLIVDDNKMNLKVEGLLLKKYGIDVVSAMSGPEAIEMLENDKAINLVFMDYMMPGMDGAEATRIARSKGIETPIIAVTANTVSGASEGYYEAGMNDYLPKPIDINRMEDILKKWIAGTED
jgi:signal transduction histidine kinase/DNA-binding LacI/PurR family transcriptional regulator/CheY-like chemotaxis protein